MQLVPFLTKETKMFDLVFLSVVERRVSTWKRAVFWLVASYNLVHRHFKDAGGLHHQDSGRSSKHLANVGKLIPVHTALQPRRQPSSCSPPREPQISLVGVLFFRAVTTF
jgi:hypothetical protein